MAIDDERRTALDVRADDGTGTIGRPVPAGRDRRTPGWLRPALIGALVGGVLVAGWLQAGELVRHEPTVDLTITPHPSTDQDRVEGLREHRALDVFRDPDRAGASLPGWLNLAFPASTVARLTTETEPIRGASIYAAVSNDEIACLIVRLDSNGMDWNCTSVDRVTSGGMTLRTLIPADLGSGTDGDGDGVAGELSRVDLLVVDWRADGSFVVSRTPR